MKRRLLAEQKNDNFVDSYFFLFLLDLIISSLKSSLNLLLDFVTKELLTYKKVELLRSNDNVYGRAAI